MFLHQGPESLGEEECLRLLAGESIGRVGISVGALPIILPVNYSMVDGRVVFRTADRFELRAALDHTVVAFEVDRADLRSREAWSVLVVGLAEELVDEKCDLPPILSPHWAGANPPFTFRISPELVTGQATSLPLR